MSTTKRLTNISQAQITGKGVQALANRPNASAQYGVGGLSAESLKLWFDKLATFLAGKVNELQNTLSADDAVEYIRVNLDSLGISNFKDMVDKFIDGDFAADVLKLYASSTATQLLTLQAVINSLASQIVSNDTDISGLSTSKLDKVTSSNANKRVYTVDTDGTQTETSLSDTPTALMIPVYATGGKLNVAAPTQDTHSANKKYVNDQDKQLAAVIETSIDPSTYVATFKLKNTAGTVLSTATIDLPIESMIIGGSYANGVLTLRIRNDDTDTNNNEININISALISGLVNTSTYESGVAELNASITEVNDDLVAFIAEVDLNTIYGHTAFYAEEAETARSYTKGGKIDKKLLAIEKDLGTVSAKTVSLSMDSDYKLTVALKNAAGTVVSSAMVDLPLESLITNASYANGTLTLTFQSGQTYDIAISSLISGLVANTRTVNGKPLSADITLTPSDIGCYPTAQTYTKTETDAKVAAAKSAVESQIDGKEVVGYAAYSAEAEKASGYVKGGAIDKEIQKILIRLADLESASE